MALIAQSMSRLVDARIGFRLSIVLAGAVLAASRRTASRWFRAAGVADDWDRFYDVLISVGKHTTMLMQPLLVRILERFDPGPNGVITFAIDDSPTKRYGRHVEAANVRHNPKPGPADGKWLYGHNWVCLAIVLQHSLWGVLALPLLSMLYVRQRDVARLKLRADREFHTKHELTLQLVREAFRSSSEQDGKTRSAPRLRHKEVWGAGQQQVRNVWSNIGCWHLNTWLYTMVELACWGLPADERVDRSDRTWDNQRRRPSHADRRRKIAREMLDKQFLKDVPRGIKRARYRDRIRELLNLAA